MRDIRLTNPVAMLALMKCRGVGPGLAKHLVESFEYLSDIRDANQVAGKVPKSVSLEWPSPIEWGRLIGSSERLLEDSNRLGIRVHGLWEAEYPQLLRAIPDPPLILYTKGRLSRGNKTVACVGTREPSQFGKVVADRVSRILAADGWSVTSGLAIGIDSISHEAALSEGGHTTAVLAGPLDSIYPKKNAKLAERILGEGGALVSEQPINAPVGKGNFVRRDRIQSGLSIATVIFQTGIKGGAIHTAKYTLLQDRLLVVPVPIGDHRLEEKSQGIIALATMKGEDLLECFGADRTLEAVIRRKYWDQPPAFQLHGNTDYDRLLQALSDRRELISAALDRRAAQPHLFQ